MEVLAGAEVDLFIPSFPELQNHFHLSPFMVELTLGANFCAYCLASLIVGQLADRYGRKPLMIWGLLIFIVGSFFCVGAEAYWHLILGRFLQGLGIAAPAVLAFVVIADSYPLEKQQRLMGLLNGAIALAMAFAPVVGSRVNLYYGWVGNFLILLVLGCVCLGMAVFFITPQQKPLVSNKTLSLFKDYVPVFASRKTRTYMLTVTFFIVPFWVFIGMAPLFYMEGMGVSLENFGYYQGALAFTFGIVSLTSGLWLQYFGVRRCFYGSMIICILTTIAIGFVSVMNLNHPLLITGISMGWSTGVVLPINILYPLALESLEGAKGRISAAIQSVRLLITAFGLQFAGYFYHGTFQPIAFVMIISFCMGLCGVYILISKYNISFGFPKEALA